MKILFIVWDLSKGNDANINIAKILSKELIINGNEVYMLGKGNSEGISQIRPFSKINYLFIEEKEYKKGKAIFNKKETLENKFMFFSSMKKFLIAKISQKKLLDKYVNRIEDLCEAENFDLAVAVSFPPITSLALASANIRSKKVIYQLDPYFSNIRNKKKSKSLKEEIKIINKIDLLFVTKLIFEANEKNELSPYYKKMYPLEFPNIRPLIKTESTDTKEFDSTYINCVFVGNLYKDIRNPEFLIQVFSSFKNKKILLHFIGGGDMELLYEFEKILGDRIKIYGIVDHEIAINAILEANILINIGNNISNQMPSKIFDYISTGKPILNFYKIIDCPTLKYTKKYPLCLDILESRNINDDILENIESYCETNKDKNIDYSIIKDLYSDCTSENVGLNFSNKINEIVGEKGKVF